jgi:hypothetical protein
MGELIPQPFTQLMGELISQPFAQLMGELIPQPFAQLMGELSAFEAFSGASSPPITPIPPIHWTTRPLDHQTT